MTEWGTKPTNMEKATVEAIEESLTRSQGRVWQLSLMTVISVDRGAW